MQRPADRANAEAIAAAFVQARRAGAALPAYPGIVPDGLDDAYAVQELALKLDGRPIAGWKVGKIPPPFDAALGRDRLSGPIFTDQVFAHDPAVPVAMPVFAAGFAAAEAEWLLRLAAAPDPAKRHYTIEEACGLIDAVHVGIEIASSPYPGINRDGPLVTISDYGNNNGLVVGAPVADWRIADIAAWPVRTLVNGAIVGEATAATMLDGPFGAARFLLEQMAARGIALAAGQWISSGAVTGVHEVAVGDAVETRFGEDLAVRCTIVAR